MAGFANDIVYANNGDFSIAGSTKGSLANGLLTNGQIWIGTTAVNAGGTHISVGMLTSPDGSLTIGYSSPNITLQVAGGAPYFSLTPFIVGPDTHSQYHTIGTAISAAVAAGVSSSNPMNIYIKPQSGGYVEDITLPSGLNLVGFTGSTPSGQNSPTIQGNIIDNGVAIISVITNLNLKTNANNIITLTGSGSTIAVIGCTFSLSNHTGCSIASGGTLNIMNCNGDLATTGIALWSGAGTVRCQYSNFSNSGASTTASTISSLLMIGSQVTSPLSTSSTGTATISFSSFDTSTQNATCLTTAGIGTINLRACRFLSGSASAISVGAGTTVNAVEVSANSSNTNVLTGAGTLNYSFITFDGSSSGHNVTTENALATLI